MITSRYINRIPPIRIKPSVKEFISNIPKEDQANPIFSIVTRCYNKLMEGEFYRMLNRMVFNPYHHVIFRFKDSLIYDDEEKEVVVNIRLSLSNWYSYTNGTYGLDFKAMTTIGNVWEIEEQKYDAPDSSMDVTIVSVERE